MSNQGIRWEQRFNNFSKALAKLEEAVHYVENYVLKEDSTEEAKYAEVI